MAIRSATVNLGSNICQGNIIILMKIGLTFAIKSIKIAICLIKIEGYTTPIHHRVLENNLDQHFPQTRRSHDRNLVKACLPIKLLFCF